MTLAGTFPLDLFASAGGVASAPAAVSKPPPEQPPQIAATDSKSAGTPPSQSTLRLALQPLDVGEIGRILGDSWLQGEVSGEITTTPLDDAMAIQGHLAPAAGGMVALNAKLHAKRQPIGYDGRLIVTAFDLSALAAKPGLESDINLQLQIRGEGFEPARRNARLELAIERSQVGDIAIDPSEIRLKADGERFEVEAFDLNTSILEADLAGEIDLAGRSNLRYAVSLTPADLRELLGADPLEGQVSLTGHLQGEWPGLMASGVLSGNDLRYEDTRLDRLEFVYEAMDLGGEPQAEARLYAQALRVGWLGIDGLSVQSQYVYDSATHQLDFDAKTAESSPLYASLQGTATANDQRQTLTIPEFALRFGDHTWRASKPLKAVRTPDEIRLEPFRLTHDEESIEVAGALIGDELENVRLQATDINLDFLQRAFSLPAVVAGRLSSKIALSGSLTAPVLKSTVMLRSTGEEALPLERANGVLRYEHEQLETALCLIQAGRETVALQAALPIDLALVAKPLERRLRDRPLNLELALERPDLAALNQALPEMPALSGTLAGILAVAGTYDRLSVESAAELHQLGRAGAASQLQGALQLTANVVSAPSLSALREAIASHSLTVTVPELTLRVPSLTGQLEGGESATALALHDVSADVSATWDGGALTTAVSELEIHAQVADFPPMDVLAKARLESEQLSLQQLSLRTPASRLTGAGQVNLARGTMQFSLNIPQLQLAEFEGVVPPALPSVVAGTVDIGGTLQTPELDARLQYGTARINADASARLAEPQQPFRARVNISHLDVAEFAPELNGQLRALLEVQGSGLTEATPEARLSLDVESMGFELAPGLSARARARVSAATLQVDLFDIASEPFAFSAQGTLSATQPTDLDYRLVIRDLAAVAQQLGIELVASGELTGHVTGELDSLRTQSTLDLNDWRYGPWQGAELRARFAGKALATDPALTFQARATEVQGPPLAPSSLDLEGRFADAIGTFALKVIEGPFKQSRVAGVVETAPALQLRIEPLRLQTEQWTWRNVKPIELRYDAEQTLILAPLELKSAASRLRAEGRLSPPGTLSGRVRLEKLPIKATVSAFVPAAPIPDGTLSVELELDGTVAEPRLEGTLQVAGLQWSEQPLGEVRAQLTSSGSRWRGAAHWTDGDESLLSLNARLDTEAATALTLAIEAPSFDLARLQAFSPAIRESAGRLRIDLEVEGTLDQLGAEGIIELENGRLVHAAIGEPYTDIQSRTVFRGHRIELERLQVNAGAGSARLQGWLETAGRALRRANLTLEANEFTAIKTRALEAVVSSKLTLRGSQEDLAASGRVTLPRARIRYENLPATGPSEVEPWELTVAGVYGPGPEALNPAGAAESNAVAAEAKADLLSFLRANIQLEMPRNVWIQGKGTAIELMGQLRLRKDRGQPVRLAGDIQTLRGFATLLDRRFNLAKGVVTFTGSEDINPILNITATYEVADYTVYVTVTGRSQAPDIAYRSEPELTQQDILSLLIFGRTSDRLNSSEQTTLGQAQQFAGGLAAGMLERTIGRALGLDTVAIELGHQGRESRVGVGRYLTQNIFVEYQRRLRDLSLGNRVGNAVTVEFSINRDFKVRAMGSDFGETAIDFLWRRDN
ncbi:MAG: translocation/assembly module TamB domain-containing protein [Gammaproteobacteria bacterium]